MNTPATRFLRDLAARGITLTIAPDQSTPGKEIRASGQVNQLTDADRANLRDPDLRAAILAELRDGSAAWPAAGSIASWPFIEPRRLGVKFLPTFGLRLRDAIAGAVRIVRIAGAVRIVDASQPAAAPAAAQAVYFALCDPIVDHLDQLVARKLAAPEQAKAKLEATRILAESRAFLAAQLPHLRRLAGEAFNAAFPNFDPSQPQALDREPAVGYIQDMVRSSREMDLHNAQASPARRSTARNRLLPLQGFTISQETEGQVDD